MTKEKRLRLPAGPGGPPCLRPRRAKQVSATTAAILQACDELLLERRRPSISLVVTRSGYHDSTVKREPYAGMVRAAKACFDLIESGLPLADARSIIGTTMPKPRASAAEVLPGMGQDLDAPAGPTIRAMAKTIARLEDKVQRRDRQLRYVLPIVRRLRSTLRWHRKRTDELERQAEALASLSLSPRAPKRWDEDFASAGHYYTEDEDNE